MDVDTMRVENMEGEKMDVADDNSEKPELYDEIYKCYKQKQYRDCLALLDEVTEEHIGYQILKSACMIHLGEKVSEAHRILDDVLLRCPENEFTIYAKGLAYYHEELWEDAAKCFAQARSMNSTSEMERAEVMLGKAQEKMKLAALEQLDSEDKSESSELFRTYRSSPVSSSKVVRRFGCELCNHFFGKKFNLDRHNRSIHNRKTPENYPSSPSDIKSSAPAKAVVVKPVIKKEVITPEKKTPVSSTASTFGGKKVRCKVCKKLFKKSSIARHEVIHTAVKAHPCGQCSMAFHQKSDLQRHEVSLHSQDL